MSKRMLYRIDYVDSKKHIVVDEEKVQDLLDTNEWFKLPMDASKALLKTLSLEKETLIKEIKKEPEAVVEEPKPKRKYTRRKKVKEE